MAILMRVWISAVFLVICTLHPVFAMDTVNSGGSSAETGNGLTNGKTALMYAARKRQYARVLRLLQEGADVNRVNQTGGTPLMYAVLGGDPRTVTLLLVHGADVNARAENGWSAVMIAAAKGYAEIMKLLLEKGADPDLQDVYHWTPLMRAGFENRASIVELLLQDERVEVNRRGENGITALHLAAVKGHAEIARLLLGHGADRRIKDSAGRTAYQIALERQLPNLVNMLGNL